MDSTSEPLILYKYRPDNEYTEHIFLTHRVWLSTAKQLNDPFECTIQEIAAEWIEEQIAIMKASQLTGFLVSLRNAFEQGDHYYGISGDQLSDLHKSFVAEKDLELSYRRMRNFVELASGMNLSNPDRLFGRLDDQLNSVGIFSMSKSPDNPLMWAHYGENHSGICLGFFAETGSMLADNEHCFPVRYSSEVPAVPIDGLQLCLSYNVSTKGVPISTNQVSFNDPTFQAAIVTKAPAWSYEQEWRYIEPVAGEYPWPGMLKEITFGLRCSQKRRDRYISLIKESVLGEVKMFEIQKQLNSNNLRRVAIGLIRGNGPVQSSFSHDNESIKRVMPVRLFHEQIEQLVCGCDFEVALEMINEQLEKEPMNYPALYQKGMTLGHMGKHKKAIEFFEQCCIRFPEDPIVWYQKGVALTELGQNLLAIDAYLKAREIDPYDASTEFNLGILYIRTRKMKEGRDHLEAAVRNGHPRAARVIGMLFSDNSKVKQSLDRLRFMKVKRNDPCPCGSGKKFKKCHGK